MKKIFAVFLALQLVFTPLSVFATESSDVDDTAESIEISKTNFPDEVLYGIISGYDVDKNSKLEGDEITSFINGSDFNDVLNFKGFELFPDLTYISIGDITGTTKVSLDFGDSSYITGIYINDYENLENIDVSGCVNLTSLTVQGTSITELDLTKNLILGSLRAGDNELLSELKLNESASFTSIGVENTAISTLDLSGMEYLSYVSCYNTNISYLDISASSGIDTFQASGSKLEEVKTSDSGKIIADGDVITNSELDSAYLTANTFQGDEEVVLPDSVTAIGYHAFVGDNTARQIELPENVTELFYNAFYDCDRLEVLSIEADGFVFGIDTVVDADNLTSIYFSGSNPALISYNDNPDEVDHVIEGSFAGLNVTVYYPEGDDSWDSVIKENFGENVTFEAWDPDEGLPELAPEVTDPDASTDVKTSVKVEVSDDEIKNLIDSGDKKVTIEVEVTEDTKDVEAIMSSDSITSLIESDVEELVIDCGIVTMTIDQATLKTVSATVKGAVTFKAEKLDNEALDDDVKDIVGDRPVFDFTISDSEGNKVSEFDGKVTVAIPYTLADGEKAENLVIYYLTEDGKVEKIDILGYSDGVILFETTHFSSYAVGYEEAAEDGGIVTPDTGDSTSYVALVFMVASLMGIFVTKKKEVTN